ncbi:MAG: zinc ribbon domain-containing protein [Coriobacteriia bacterium]|nr:zinc ribbon domain-containing protein [Coriobacteriia bacterium]
MPFCSSCGQQEEADAVFCTNCGSRLDGVVSSPASSPEAPRPVLPARQSIVSVAWNAFDGGLKTVAVGSVGALAGFFLPIFESYNGVDMAQEDFTWWLRLAVPVATLALLYIVAMKDSTRIHLQVTGACIALGSVWGFQLLNVLRGSAALYDPGAGWYVLHSGLIAIALGGFVSLSLLARSLELSD